MASYLTTIDREEAIGLEHATEQGLTPYAFQSQGVELAELMIKARQNENEDGKGGVLILDEMGLGKTIEAIMLVARMAPRPKKVLIIAPNTLKAEWKKALLKWLPNEEIAIFATGKGGLRRFYGLLEDAEWLKMAAIGTRFLITNYETMRNAKYMEIIQAFNADVLIWDEAHRLRNHDRKTSIASRRLTAPVEIVLTGTPVVNHAGDYWALVNRVSERIAGTASSWEYNFINSYRGQFGVKKSGVKNSAELKVLLSKIAIQREKKEVLRDLPPKIYRDVPLDMEDDQREVYESMENQLFVMLDEGQELWATNVLAHLMRLRQLCVDPRIVGVTGVSSAKTEFIKEFFEDVGSEQFVIFSNFEKYISLLEIDLLEKGFSVGRLTGKEKVERRSQNIEDFWEGKIQVMLGTPAAGGEGVNLQCANKIMLVDKWWSPYRNDQAIDRLHRIGQLEPVEVILPACVETVDEALNEVLDRKYSVINETRIQGDVMALLKKWRSR